MTADTFRQASLFEWVPKPLTVKPWDVPGDVLVRQVAEQYIADLGKIPDPADYDLPIQVESNSFTSESEQKYIRITGGGLVPLYTFIDIKTGKISNCIQTERRGEYDKIRRICIEGDKCLVSAGTRTREFRLAEADWTPDYPREAVRKAIFEGCSEDCGAVALTALNLGYGPDRVEYLTYGPVNSTIYSPARAMKYPESADLLMELAEHHGLPTWLNQDVPDLYQAGLTKDRYQNCASCRHREYCHPDTSKTETELRNQGCSFYGRNLKLKGTVKAPKCDEEASL